MIDETLRKLIEFLENASPVVWQTLIKQVYVEAIANAVWCIALVVSCVLLAKLGNYGRKIYENDSYSMWQLGLWLAYAGSSICGLVAFGLLVSVVTHIANPEFYAIRFILQSVVQ